MSGHTKASKFKGSTGARAGKAPRTLDLKSLLGLPPWEWPREAPGAILGLLRDRMAPEKDRRLAVVLAGGLCDPVEDTFKACLAILACPEEPEALRAAAAIALGPGLEQAEERDWDDPEEGWLSPSLFEEAKEVLHEVWQAPGVPKVVRRKLLEAAVRAPQAWHADAVRAAYRDADLEWKLTAVFAMYYLQGFEDQILEALEHPDPEIQYEAVRAAGTWELVKAWPHVRAILSRPPRNKDLLLAALEAAPGLSETEAGPCIAPYLDSKDEEVAEVAMEAMAMADGEDWGEDPDEDEWGDIYFKEGAEGDFPKPWPEGPRP